MSRGDGRRTLGQPIPQNLRNLAKRQAGIGEDMALAPGMWRFHRRALRLGNVTHVDIGQDEIRDHRHLALQQALHQADRSAGIIVEKRPEHRAGIDHRQPVARASRVDQIPARLFREGLGLAIGIDTPPLDLGPILCREGAVIARIPAINGRDRRGQNDAPMPNRQPGGERPTRALDSLDPAPTIACWSLVHGFARLALDGGVDGGLDDGAASASITALLPAMLDRLNALD